MNNRSVAEKEKMLYSIREFGNTSSASIPTTICANYKKFKSKKNNNQTILSGFGAGYSYAAAHLDLSKTKRTPVTCRLKNGGERNFKLYDWKDIFKLVPKKFRINLNNTSIIT